MADTAASGGAGGAANERGSEFRASLAAWIATHALVGRPLPGLELLPGHDVPSGRVAFEGDTAVDDLVAELTGGATLLVQAKSSLSLSQSPTSEFAKTAHQFARQARQADFDPATTRLVIAVGAATGRLRELQRALTQRRQPEAAHRTTAERDALAVLSGHLAELSPEDRDRVLDATVVLLPDLTSPEAPARDGCIAWLESQVVEAGHGDTAWYALERSARHRAARRFGHDLDGWLEVLARAPVPLRADHAGAPGPRRQATRLALQRYRDRLVARGRRVSLRALGAAVPDLEVAPSTRALRATTGEPTGDLVGDDGVELAWLVRRLGRTLLLGEPGIGKTTALRRLAAELAAGRGDPPSAPHPLPVVVSVPRFADAMQLGTNALETLVDVAVRELPEEDRALLHTEVLAQCRTHGRALLLLDGLDECRGRRHAVVEAMRQAFGELHADVEVVVATRDVAYADAAPLSLTEARLTPPRDLESSVRVLAGHLAAALPHATAVERARWVDAVTELALRREDRGGDERTPLAAVGRVVLAARDGLDALRAGRAVTRAALVDWIARRWEIDERDRGDRTVSAQLTPEESHDFVVQAFDVIAYALDADRAVRQDVLAAEVARWAQSAWQLPAPRARTAAGAALAFWDEAGIFVAGGAEAVVRPRLATLQELGAARWLAQSATASGRAAWTEAHLADPEREETLALLGELDDDAAAALVRSARARNDGRLGLLAARVLAERAPTASAHRALVADAVGALAPHLAPGGRSGWKVFGTLLRLPVDGECAAAVLHTVEQHYDPRRAALARALAALRWAHPTLDRTALLAVLADGPPAPWPVPDVDRRDTRAVLLAVATVDPLYNQLASELAASVVPGEGEVVDALLRARHMSLSTQQAVHATLRQRGWGDRVDAAEHEWMADTHVATRELIGRAVEVHRRFLEYTAALAEPAATYGQLRRLDELVAYYRTAMPGDMDVASTDRVYLQLPDLARDALRCVARLGGFDERVLAAQASALAAESNHPRWSLGFGAVTRELTCWPERDDATEPDGALLDRVARLFTGSAWTADIARRALIRHPDPAHAAAIVAATIPAVRNWEARGIAARTLLRLDSRPQSYAKDWLRSADPVLARIGAVALARFFRAGHIGIDALRPALLDSDDATRARVRTTLTGCPPNLALEALLDESRERPRGVWVCLACEHTNPSSRDSCHQCRLSC